MNDVLVYTKNVLRAWTTYTEKHKYETKMLIMYVNQTNAKKIQNNVLDVYQNNVEGVRKKKVDIKKHILKFLFMHLKNVNIYYKKC